MRTVFSKKTALFRPESPDSDKGIEYTLTDLLVLPIGVQIHDCIRMLVVDNYNTTHALDELLWVQIKSFRPEYKFVGEVISKPKRTLTHRLGDVVFGKIDPYNIRCLSSTDDIIYQEAYESQI